MRDYQDGSPGGCLLDEQLEYLSSGPEVELARRLVGQQHRVSGGQGPGYRDALLLAAGQFVWEVMGPVSQSHGLDHRLRGHNAALPRDVHAELDVLQGGEPREQVEALEDKAHGLASEGEKL